MNFDLHSLGWKAFQDLAVAIASEVLDRPIQTFLASRDGGRDGAFIGTWEGAQDTPEAKSTVQCKFTGKRDGTLTLSKLKTERSKVARLAARGLAHDYIILTNAGCSGSAEEEIAKAFVAEGARNCRVFDGGWIVEQIKQRARLRMMVPRLYGIGDLTQIIDSRYYAQARYILSAMGDDLDRFATTASHRQAVAALHRAGFVLLLGDPASGKSTIAATLAIGALDDGCSGAIRISSPDQLDRWNPDENQFLWVDDAFGPNQLDFARTSSWNAELPRLRAAVKRGTKVVFTSRNYIWASAQRLLRTSQFPLLEDSQVVIDVAGLSDTERAQILYNHIKYGDQPAGVRRALKPILAEVAANPAFLPEAARRLGDPYFTKGRILSRDWVMDMVEHPVEFLAGVIETLDFASQAAIGLIFLSPAGGVPSPIADSEALATVSRLHGVSVAQIARALEDLNGSLTLLVEHPQGPRWTFRHPTINDAFATVVAGSKELVELYVRGAKLERLMVEVSCGRPLVAAVKVLVPHSLYDLLLHRLKFLPIDPGLIGFLYTRCDDEFLARFVIERPDVFQVVGRLYADLSTSGEARLLARLNAAGLLPEEYRKKAVQRITDLTLEDLDANVFIKETLRSLFTSVELEAVAEAFKAAWLIDLDETLRHWRHDYIISPMKTHAETLKQNLDRAEHYFRDDDALVVRLYRIHQKIDDWIDDLDDDEEYLDVPEAPAPPKAPTGISSIFDDVDD